VCVVEVGAVGGLRRCARRCPTCQSAPQRPDLELQHKGPAAGARPSATWLPTQRSGGSNTSAAPDLIPNHTAACHGAFSRGSTQLLSPSAHSHNLAQSRHHSKPATLQRLLLQPPTKPSHTQDQSGSALLPATRR
jgi:hypothetical protein